MSKKLHIICAKCGSDDVEFKTKTCCAYSDCECSKTGSYITYIKCNNCLELTSTNEWNEFNKK